MVRLKGFLYIADCFECKNIITGPELLKAATRAVEKAHMAVAQQLYENFPEHKHHNEYGDSVLTLIIPLEQSHLVIHTWPDYKLVSIDLYTCGDRALAKLAVKYLIDIFDPKRKTLRGLKRGTNK